MVPGRVGPRDGCPAEDAPPAAGDIQPRSRSPSAQESAVAAAEAVASLGRFVFDQDVVRSRANSSQVLILPGRRSAFDPAELSPELGGLGLRRRQKRCTSLSETRSVRSPAPSRPGAAPEPRAGSGTGCYW